MADNAQVRMVLTFLQGLGKDLVQNSGLYLNLSRLDKKVRTEQNLTALREVFAEQIKAGAAKLFDLPNGDMLVIYAKTAQDEAASNLVKLRFLLQDDEKVAAKADLQESGAAEIIDLIKDYGRLTGRLAKLQPEAETAAAILRPNGGNFFDTKPARSKQPMTTELLDKVQKIIAVSDFSSFIRRQSVCAVIGKSQPQRVFEEVYVSIPDMRDSLLPNVDIMSDAWLFLALTETLDRRVLEIISRHDDGALRSGFSVNINVSTILSDEFLRFDETIDASMRRTIVLEIQLVDIFSDMRSYDLAKTFARSRGYKICIDGITVDKLEYLNRAKLDCDLMKIVWHPDFGRIMSEDKHFTDYMNKAERAKIILCRIDDENAVEVGNSLGINLYQGRYIQRMLSRS
ncbi:MAG: EAL domain-containing protein [Alphaproteobacteria bacterium]|nr:EAL domain-containing protein [Alphaproteobacteria bacterium]